MPPVFVFGVWVARLLRRGGREAAERSALLPRDAEASVGPSMKHPFGLKRAQNFDDGAFVRKRLFGLLAAQVVEQLLQ